MENTNQSNTPAPKSSNTWLYILLIVLALGIIGLSFWLISVKNNMNDLLAEKEVQRVELVHELDSLMAEHDQIKKSYGEISDSLTVMDSVIQARAEEIKKLLNYKWEYYKVKKKLDKLQVISQGYIRKMDSIVEVNQDLTEENIQIKEEIKQEKRKNLDLQKEKEELTQKVDEAAVLSAYNMTSEPVHVKGSGKEVPTNKIKRVDRVKVCFTIGKNAVIEPGIKTLYIRIARPDEEILMKGRGDEYTFTYQGEVLQYSIKEDVDYQNEAQYVCFYWNRRPSLELQPGLYHVDVFSGDNIIGETTFVLK
jgi:multidrug efflux pump subunit AcrB